MDLLNKNCDLELYWRRLEKSEQALLLLDFDGTLAPFVDDPAAARPYPGIVPLLQEIIAAQATRLVVISGRDISSLMPCLEMDPLPELWGCHGWQRRLPGGETLQRGLPDEAQRLLQRAQRLAENAGYGMQLEKKAVSLALHWRGCDDDVVRQMQESLGGPWRELTQTGALHLKNFDGWWELCCPSVNKGSAVEQLLLETGSDAEIAYLGDDLTDEDAFAALDGRGLKVLVRPGLRKTAADLWLQPPDELFWFLRRWHECRGRAA